MGAPLPTAADGDRLGPGAGASLPPGYGRRLGPGLGCAVTLSGRGPGNRAAVTLQGRRAGIRDCRNPATPARPFFRK